MNELTNYDAARRALERATKIDEAKAIKDKAVALEAYARQRNDVQMEAWCSEIKIRALVRIGELSKGLEKAYAGGRGKIALPIDGKSKLRILKAAGISKNVAYRCEALAEIKRNNGRALENFIEGKVKAKQPVKYTEIEAAFLRQEKDDRRKAALQARVEIESTGLVVGDFREKAADIADDTVELIFTDPPYDRKSVSLYEDAARIGARILKPGGSLICYCGHYLLPDILPAMQKHLRYWWLNACVHADRKARMKYYGVVVGWKPMLWFVKGMRGDLQTFVSDTVSGAREKDIMEWQQAVNEAAYYIGRLTSPNGLIVDFCAGGGTTCVAAKHLGRPWLAFEKDPIMAKKTDQRISKG